ncbi:MAG: hypothetical protein ABI895_41265 [Deltaproteobacteria bacterium]
MKLWSAARKLAPGEECLMSLSGERGNRAQIDRMQRRLEQWRQRHGGPGRPIPKELWDGAAEVARVEGVAVTARALRLDRYRLAQRTEVEADAHVGVGAEASAGFVEVDARRFCLPQPTLLRFESRDGERLEVELGAATAVDVVALAEAFWGRRR